VRSLRGLPNDERRRFTYYPGGKPIPELFAVDVTDRSHTITAEVVIPPGGAEGVLAAQGLGERGYALYIEDGRLHYVSGVSGGDRSEIHSDTAVPEGAVRLGFTFARTAPRRGVGTLAINGRVVGEGTIVQAPGMRRGAFCCGFQTGRFGLDARRAPPAAFSGTIERVTVDVDGETHRDAAAALRVALSED
jgi:arylsulfatase